MILQPGCPLVVAPAFHLPIDWPERLRLGTGTQRDGEGFFPRPGWRAPDDRELALLAAPPLTPPQQDLAGCLCLFCLPQHIRSAWWQLLERARETGAGRLEGFESFVASVAEFLAFKDLPVPEGAAFDLLVSTPGLRSIGRPGAARGLTFSLATDTPYPVADAARWPRFWGGINLGDEAMSLLFINLPAPELLAELRRHQREQFSPGTVGKLAERFLTLCPDYPPVRLRIEPGEGFRLPAAGLLVDACTLDRIEPDVLLLVHISVAPCGTRC